MFFRLFPHGTSPSTPLIKRILDLLISAAGLLVLSPVLVSLGISVWITHGTPILFRQKRPGLHGKIFTLYKFRTMRNTLDSHKRLLPDEKRLTRFGKFMRSSSLDELPELINVLKGEMSLVGPRPLLVQYLPRYSPEQARRHNVLPGITGLAQINGRNVITWDDKFRLDVWYVDHWSMGLDLKILALTAWKVLSREGINQPGEATTQEFMGSEKQG